MQEAEVEEGAEAAPHRLTLPPTLKAMFSVRPKRLSVQHMQRKHRILDLLQEHHVIQVAHVTPELHIAVLP